MNNVKSWSAEKISRRVFYLLIGLAVLVFGLFFLVGYDMPFEENPDFNAPLFTNVLIVLMCGLLFLALLLAVVALVISYKRSSVRQAALTKEVPEQKISRITWGVTAALLLITFILGSTEPLVVNGEEYADKSWLRLSDMFVYTSIILLIGAFAVVAFGATRYIRKKKKWL